MSSEINVESVRATLGSFIVTAPGVRRVTVEQFDQWLEEELASARAENDSKLKHALKQDDLIQRVLSNMFEASFGRAPGVMEPDERADWEVIAKAAVNTIFRALEEESSNVSMEQERLSNR